MTQTINRETAVTLLPFMANPGQSRFRTPDFGLAISTSLCKSFVKVPASQVNSGPNKNAVILLIEDENNDVVLFRRALADVNYGGTLKEVNSVKQARAYMEGLTPFEDRGEHPLPNLIVSDMNMPGANGYDFLEWLREQDKFCDLPFLFLSGSFAPLEKGRANELGVLVYAKTASKEVMRERIQSILALLPPERPSP